MTESERQLLLRYFHNTCTDAERRQAQELLRSPGAAQFLQDLAQQEWDEPIAPEDAAAAAYERMRANVAGRMAADKPAPRPSILVHLKRYRHAASWLVLLLVTAAVLYKVVRMPEVEPLAIARIVQTNQHGVPVKYQLPDSSVIYLAAGSTISYPETFTGNTREVDMEGQAFFEVTRNPEKPFIIHTGAVATRVLGTSFRVSTLDSGNVEVAVATGKVGVSQQGKTFATLTPGNKVKWAAKEQQATLGKVDIARLLAWKNGELLFEQQSMQGIAAEMQSRYGIQIVFKDKQVSQRIISGTFSANKTATQVMQVLAVAGQFRYEIDNNQTYSIYNSN